MGFRDKGEEPASLSASVSLSDRDEVSFPVELQQSVTAEAEAKKQHPVRVSNSTFQSIFLHDKTQLLLTPQTTQCVKLFFFLPQATTEGDRDVWEGFRASLRLLQPALVLPLAPDLLSPTTDPALLPPPPPPPPPPAEEEDGVTERDTQTDSPMM